MAGVATRAMITNKQVDDMDTSLRKSFGRRLPDEKIEDMVTRFLNWKLPKDFTPDSGIAFNPTKPYEGDEFGNSWWPVGTNLLSAEQARKMIEHVIFNDGSNN